MRARVDTSQVVRAYQTAFNRIAQLTGFDQRAILLGEAGVILKTWAGRTKVAKPEQAMQRARYRAGKRTFGDVSSASTNPYGISINTGAKHGYPGVVWFRTRNKKFQQAGVITNKGDWVPGSGVVFYPVHFRDSDWAKIDAGARAYAGWLRALLPVAEKSVGLARQSVIQIADSLGIDLTQVKGGGTLSAAGIAKARAAIASNGRAYVNGRGSHWGNAVRYHVQLINRLPYGIKAGMDRTLAGVLAGRVKYFETSYKKGAFDSIKSAARAFPNIVRVSNS
jgi:hypothetical protein